jgi:hypothetical protein
MKQNTRNIAYIVGASAVVVAIVKGIIAVCNFFSDKPCPHGSHYDNNMRQLEAILFDPSEATAETTVKAKVIANQMLPDTSKRPKETFLEAIVSKLSKGSTEPNTRIKSSPSHVGRVLVKNISGFLAYRGRTYNYHSLRVVQDYAAHVMFDHSTSARWTRAYFYSPLSYSPEDPAPNVLLFSDNCRETWDFAEAGLTCMAPVGVRSDWNYEAGPNDQLEGAVLGSNTFGNVVLYFVDPMSRRDKNRDYARTILLAQFKDYGVPVEFIELRDPSTDEPMSVSEFVEQGGDLLEVVTTAEKELRDRNPEYEARCD